MPQAMPRLQLVNLVEYRETDRDHGNNEFATRV